jgi:hypothetical protein
VIVVMIVAVAVEVARMRAHGNAPIR